MSKEENRCRLATIMFNRDLSTIGIKLVLILLKPMKNLVCVCVTNIPLYTGII